MDAHSQTVPAPADHAVSTAPGTALPLSERVQEALAVTKRGVDELLIEANHIATILSSYNSRNR